MLSGLNFRISNERFQDVENEIAAGSEPKLRFYILVAVSTLIASFGLITDSTAVIIGAMLVAPLMTPIFGMALALVRGNPTLLKQAIRAEAVGVVLSVAMGLFIGLLYPTLDSTPEMLSRTHPNLFDLLVAVFAGLAGAYALLDEKLTPALPGVAISTAIVPPLANTGLCLSLGAYEGATGSFLLFFANFLSILLVASAVFVACGMIRYLGFLKKQDVPRRFGLAVLGFLLVVVLLSHALYKMNERRQTDRAVRAVLVEELSNFPATGMEEVIHYDQENKMYILASIRSPRNLSPLQVGRIQKSLADKLGRPVELIVRSTMTNDVTAIGSTSQVATQNLDGFFLSKKTSPIVRKTRLTEQTIRDFLAYQIGVYLYDVQPLQMGKRLIMLATIAGISPIPPETIQELQTRVQERTDDAEIGLVIRFIQMDFYDSDGLIRYEWATLSDLNPQQTATINQIRKALTESFEKRAFYLINVNWTVVEGQYHFLLEVVGERLFLKRDLEAMEYEINQKFDKPVYLHVRSKSELFVNQKGYDSYDHATRKFFSRQAKTFRNEIDKMLEATY